MVRTLPTPPHSAFPPLLTFFFFFFFFSFHPFHLARVCVLLSLSLSRSLTLASLSFSILLSSLLLLALPCSYSCYLTLLVSLLFLPPPLDFYPPNLTSPLSPLHPPVSITYTSLLHPLPPLHLLPPTAFILILTSSILHPFGYFARRRRRLTGLCDRYRCCCVDRHFTLAPTFVARISFVHNYLTFTRSACEE